MSFSATIAAAQVEAANAALEAQGFGPGNFSVPLGPPSGQAVTHYAVSCLATFPALRSAVLALQTDPGTASIHMTDGARLAHVFAAHVAGRGLERRESGVQAAPTELDRKPDRP